MCTEPKNNLALLRPLTTETMVPGTLLTTPHTVDGKAIWAFAVGPDSEGQVVGVVLEGRAEGQFASASHHSAFRLAPLTWVEGRPVYPGDELYWTYKPFHKMTATAWVDGMLTGFIPTYAGDPGMKPECLTWTDPAPKAEPVLMPVVVKRDVKFLTYLTIDNELVQVKDGTPVAGQLVAAKTEVVPIQTEEMWERWDGGDAPPVPVGTLVDVLHRNGNVHLACAAGVYGSRAYKWCIIGSQGDIMAWAPSKVTE